MSNTEQFQHVKSVDQPVDPAVDKQTNHLSSSAYGADSLIDWKKTFSGPSDEDFQRHIRIGIDIDRSEKATASGKGGDHPIVFGGRQTTETLTMPSIEEQYGLPEFRTRPANEKKDGLEYIKDKAKELFGVGETMHDRVKELVVAGLTPEQRAAYLKEEKEWKDLLGSGGAHDPISERIKNHPQGPMHDIVNKMTLAAEQKMAAQAKQGMSPMDRLQAERGVINGSSNPQSDAYEQKLLAILNGYESKGELPKGLVPPPNAQEVAKALEPKKQNGPVKLELPVPLKNITLYSNLKSW